MEMKMKVWNQDDSNWGYLWYFNHWSVFNVKFWKVFSNVASTVGIIHRYKTRRQFFYNAMERLSALSLSNEDKRIGTTSWVWKAEGNGGWTKQVSEAGVAGDNNIETKPVYDSPTSSSDVNTEFLFLVAIDLDFNDWEVEYLHSWDEYEKKKLESIVVLKV